MLLADQFTPEPLNMSNECLATEETDTGSSRVHIKTEGSDIMDRVRGCTDRDELVVHVLKELGSGANLQGDEWEECDGLVLFRGKVYVPLDPQLRHDIVEAHHDIPVTGHSGWWKTVSSIKYTTNCLCYMHWLSPISLIFIGILPIIHSLYFSCFCTAEALWTLPTI